MRVRGLGPRACLAPFGEAASGARPTSPAHPSASSSRHRPHLRRVRFRATAPGLRLMSYPHAFSAIARWMAMTGRHRNQVELIGRALARQWSQCGASAMQSADNCPSGSQDPDGNRADLPRYPIRPVASARIRHDEGPTPRPRPGILAPCRRRLVPRPRGRRLSSGPWARSPLTVPGCDGETATARRGGAAENPLTSPWARNPASPDR